ncbi:IclR family transcriptional regulator [Paenibacillus naphthalenovorans]|uniref:IclR family transcriptional regulator n=1 Tax=Paenibacillus naphthalenovorans TaxID=162209 RepID=UPI000880FC66|nr:IclR family transcriptional regulator [Paenibacillus naphthalenovorans]SDI60156.1 DNA-binding transcriptional regulator, IclR family [Paenibacillus naphthalenovorans]
MDNYLSSVKNSCKLLKIFLNAPKELGVSELSRKLELSKGAVHKLLMTLESEGFIKQNPLNKQYSLGYTLLELGNKVLKNHNLVDFAKPYLQRLSEKTKELVCLCIIDGKDAIYVDKIDSKHPIRFNAEEYRRFPLYATSAARAILAFHDREFIDEVLADDLITFTPYSITESRMMQDRLEEIRKNGYEISSNLRNVGATGIAAPIFDAYGKVPASVSVIGPTDRMTPYQEQWVRELLQITREISQELGYREGR